MTETLWLAGLLIANLWAAVGFDANNTDKEGRPYRGEIIRTEFGPPILSQIPYVGRRLFATVGYACDDGGTEEPALKHGERAACETPPTKEEVMRELPLLASGVPFVYEQHREEVEFTAEKIVDRVDDPCYFPLIGMAQMHRCRWKCVVSYTDVVETANPFPFKARTKHIEVVFIEKNQFQVCGDEKKEGAAEAPQSCPAGQFRPMVKEIVKAEPEKQVLLEVTVASVDRAAIPEATYRWAKKQLGLTGDDVGFSVPKNRDAAADLIQALQKDGFVKPLETRRVTTLSGRPARILSGGPMHINASGAGSPYQLAVDFASVVNVLPVVMGNGKIHLEIAAQMSTPTANIPVPGAGSPGTVSFSILKRTANAASEIEDGQTIVMGGLTETEWAETDSGVPLLADLPLVGALFAPSLKKTERDLLILVRARIVEPGDAAETSEPPLSSPKLAPFPTSDNGRKVHVIVDGGPDGQQTSVVRFEGQSLLELIGELDEVRADNVKEICVLRRTSVYADVGIGLPIDWKQLTQSGRCGVELMAEDRVNIMLEPAKEQRPISQPERLDSPPLTKYKTTGYPEQAFDRPTDPGQKSMDAELNEAKDSSTVVTEVAVLWYEHVQYVEDSGNKGKLLPGLVGRVYLGGGVAVPKKLVEGNGCVHVEMYDVVTGAKISECRFDAETLKGLKRTDFIGMGYTLFLPWEAYRPEITQVEVRVMYMPENVGQPQHAAPQVIRLRTATGSPIPAREFGFPMIRTPGDTRQVFSFWSGLFR